MAEISTLARPYAKAAFEYALEKGVLAENWQLVERAGTIIENMGARVIGPEEVRKQLGLTKRAPVAK